MGIRGDDARIHIQKLGDVDQIDKQQQESQRGEIGAARSKADIERERKQTTPPELEKPDTVLVRRRPHRKGKDQGYEDKDEEGEEGDEEASKSQRDVGGGLDVKG